MSEPVVYVDRFTIRDGRLADLTRYADDMVRAVEQDQPRTTLFAYYVDESGTHGTAVFVFADAEALDRHLELMSPRFAEGTALIEDASIELLGRPSDRATDLTRSFGGVIKRKLAGFGRG